MTAPPSREDPVPDGAQFGFFPSVTELEHLGLESEVTPLSRLQAAEPLRPVPQTPLLL